MDVHFNSAPQRSQGAYPKGTRRRSFGASFAQGRGADVSAVTLEIFRCSLNAIAEEMGTVLMLSSYSPNIKERRDFSCALFDAQGRLIAQAAHIPVHLGSMPDSVAAAIATIEQFAPGDIVAVNDPYLGGTHL